MSLLPFADCFSRRFDEPRKIRLQCTRQVRRQMNCECTPFAVVSQQLTCDCSAPEVGTYRCTCHMMIFQYHRATGATSTTRVCRDCYAAARVWAAPQEYALPFGVRLALTCFSRASGHTMPCVRSCACVCVCACVRAAFGTATAPRVPCTSACLSRAPDQQARRGRDPAAVHRLSHRLSNADGSMTTNDANDPAAMPI